jgi:signal transduction histidine kinase/CheY-like chemotaxis protein
MPGRLRPLVDALGESGARAEAAVALAQACGARELLLFVRDPEVGTFVPAPGMAKTVRAAAQWQAVLRSCADGAAATQLDIEGRRIHAGVRVVGECAFVLCAHVACEFPPELLEALPLLAAAMRAQYALKLEVDAAAQARQAAEQAHELARALDAARASAARVNRQLQAEHEQKDQFLAMLAHELRNPLAPMTSATELLRRFNEREADPRAARQVEILRRQLQQLTHLVDDLLDVSRVSRGLIELRRETLALAGLLATAVDSCRPLIDGRGHVLTVRPVDPAIHVDADAVRVTQVFANLLNNAAKYTAPGGHIVVEAAARGEQVEVRVCDDGAGIPREMLTSIFDLFTQVPGSLDRAPGGLGIGLTLARTLVELHGGRIHAESDGPGKGSTFVVSLPVVQPARAPLPAATEAPSAPAAGTVMIVDDNLDAATTLAEVLHLLGTQPTVARDGAEALALAQAGPLPQLVLLDIGLPGMDGYEIAREWRRRFGSGSQLVALTGYGSAEDRRRTAQAGFDAHLVKPVTVDQLLPFLQAAAIAAGPRHGA